MNSSCLPSTILALCLIAGIGVGFPATRAAQTASPHAARPPVGARTAQAVWTNLAAGNRCFVAGQPRPHELVETRRRLSQGQHPQAIVLGCSDSRVPPELLFDQTLGDLFVV